jgi:hypothetical protein
MAFALVIVMALALMLLDRLVFAPISSVAELIHNAETGSARPSAWQGFLASFYGALDEEILMRLGLLSLLALAFRTSLAVSGRQPPDPGSGPKDRPSPGSSGQAGASVK